MFDFPLQNKYLGVSPIVCIPKFSSISCFFCLPGCLLPFLRTFCQTRFFYCVLFANKVTFPPYLVSLLWLEWHLYSRLWNSKFCDFLIWRSSIPTSNRTSIILSFVRTHFSSFARLNSFRTLHIYFSFFKPLAIFSFWIMFMTALTNFCLFSMIFIFMAVFGKWFRHIVESSWYLQNMSGWQSRL